MISQKHLIVFCMISLLQSYMPLVFTLSNLELTMHI